MERIVATVTKDGATAKEIEAVVCRLERALPVERGTLGFEVGSADQSDQRLAVNFVGATLTVSVSSRHGEVGLWIAAAIASTLKQDLVGEDGSALPANSSSVREIYGQSVSEGCRVIAEKLGLVLPRMRPTTIGVRF